MSSNIVDIAIIGGGASGFAAAVSSAKMCLMQKTNKQIVVFDKDVSLGKSILKTGNGRCNFSNYYAENEKISQYYHWKFCKKVFKNCNNKVLDSKIFNCEDNTYNLSAVYKMFEDLGLTCDILEDGGMFPYSNKASSVLDVFSYEIEDLNVNIKCNYELKKIKYEDEIYKLYFKNNKYYLAKKVIFCCGGNFFGTNIFEDDYLKTKKILGSIKTDTKYTKSLDGIKVKVLCKIKNSKGQTLNKEQGELLFRKYGVSGICVFNLSRFLDNTNKQTLSIDFSPETTKEELYDAIMDRFLRKNKQDKINAKRLLAGMMLPQLAEAICKYCKIDCSNVEDLSILKIVEAIKDFQLPIQEIYDKNQCQVSRGGVNVEAISENTMEYKKMKNLYVCGELIDVDGPCGGYNLHWAWSTGILAGLSAV